MFRVVVVVVVVVFGVGMLVEGFLGPRVMPVMGILTFLLGLGKWVCRLDEGLALSSFIIVGLSVMLGLGFLRAGCCCCGGEMVGVFWLEIMLG